MIAPVGGSASHMMKAAVFLLFALLVPAYHTGDQCIDNSIDAKVQAAISNIVITNLAKAKLLCQDVSASGDLVSCPAGYKPTGCACGMGCGSWDIRSDSICHCQCGGMDWTAARCCRVGLE
ncbi:resistin-like [Carettochelys insculpta]|uniref:resistin-like n=1 Tax=Carettochelys insculpta TaxID=44489 RepID=UPI003EB91517